MPQDWPLKRIRLSLAIHCSISSSCRKIATYLLSGFINAAGLADDF